MASSPYFDYIPYRDGSMRQEITNLVDVMEQNDFKISHLRNWIQRAELPQNDVTHEQLDRAFKDTERMEKILDVAMNGESRLTYEVLLYQELLHHKDWQLSQLMELDLELMRLSSGYFSAPVMATSAIAGQMNDAGSLPPVPSARDPNLGVFSEETLDTVADSIPVYDPSHAPYPIPYHTPSPVLEDIPDMSLDLNLNLNEQVVDYTQSRILPEAAPMSVQDYIQEFVPNAAPNHILNYDPDQILEDIPDHSLDPLLDFIRGDMPDTAPDHIRDSTPYQASGDISVPFPTPLPEPFFDHGLVNIAEDAPETYPEPSPITVSFPQYPLSTPSSFVPTDPPIQPPEEVFMPSLTPASEHISEPSTEPAPNPESASTTMDAVPILVLVPVRNNKRVKKRTGKYRLIKLGGGYAYKLPRR